jgi:hypothetical protein
MADAVEADPVVLPSHAARIEWYDDSIEKSAGAQKRSRKARDYYDNHQWTAAEEQILKERQQPIITKNRIARKINFFLGEEIRKRVDPSARPRTPQHVDDARVATDALRYAEEEEKTDSVRSAVFKNMLIEGFGGSLKSMKEIPATEPGGVSTYKHTLKHVEWDRLGFDPASRAVDFSDALYRFIVLWMELDDAIALYPNSRRELTDAVHNSPHDSNTTDDVPRGKAWYDGRRKRVKIVEMYFRVGEDWYRSDFTKSGDLRPPERTFLLDENKLHSVCPLEMESCYVDANGNRYGVVELFISDQDEINKRSSKALHLLSVDRTTAEEGVVADEVKYQTQRAKPDGFNVVAVNSLVEGRIRNESGTELAQGQLQLLNEAKQDIDSIGPSASGVNELPGSISGRAFIARQQAASQELGTVFDQLRDWTHRIYELDWLCIRQYWTEEMWLRVTDDRELTGYRFVAINQQSTRAQRFQELLQKSPPVPPEQALQTAAGDMAPLVIADVQALIQQQAQMMAQQQDITQQRGAPPQQSPQPPDIVSLIMQNPLMQQTVTINQTAQMLIDIVIDEAPETAVLADEQFETLGGLMPAIVQAKPDMAPMLVRALIQASSLPNKKEILQEFDKGPDPAMLQAQQQQQAQAQQIAEAMAQMNLLVGQTKAQLQQAQAVNQQAQAALATAEAQAVPAKAQVAQAKAQTEGVNTAIRVDEHQRSMMPHAIIIDEKVTNGPPLTL